MSTKKRGKLTADGRKYRRSHEKGGGKRTYTSVRKDEIDATPEYTVMMSHDSHFWALRLDERDAFGPVTVYDGAGKVKRIIARDALVRPWQERQGNTWNNCLFPKRVSDRV